VSTPSSSPPPADRRSAPRLPVGIPVAVRHGKLRAAGRVIDASEGGLMIELIEPLPFAEADVKVSLVLPGAGRHDAPATIVRRRMGPYGHLQLALRLSTAPAPRRPEAPRWADPATAPSTPRSRPRAMALAELRALGTRAYELAVVDPEAAPPAALSGWAAVLAKELGTSPPPQARTARELLHALHDLNAAARAASPDDDADAAAAAGPGAT
jgi:hypothetical protein